MTDLKTKGSDEAQFPDHSQANREISNLGKSPFDI